MHINERNTYLESMKSRLNITIDARLIKRAKHYAEKNNTSVSQLVETYFKSLSGPAGKKNIIQLVEELPKSKLKSKIDLKAGYYEDKKKKYGF